MRREDRLDSIAESDRAFQKSQAGKNDARAEQAAINAQRDATKAVLKAANDDIKSLEKELAGNPMPEQAKVIQSQLNQARNEASRYRNALAGAGLDGSNGPASPSKPFDPKDFMAKGSAKDTTPVAPVTPVAKPQISAQEARNPIDTKEQLIGRGKYKTQYQNKKTGAWYDTQAEAISSLGK